MAYEESGGWEGRARNAVLAAGQAAEQRAGGGAGAGAVTNHNVTLQQTIYTHDSLSPYELAQEAEALAARERWRIR